MPNLARQLYKDFDFIYKINRKIASNSYPSITFIAAPMSNPYVIPYNLAAKILCVTHLHFIKD